jgi:hypothetical protein
MNEKKLIMKKLFLITILVCGFLAVNIFYPKCSNSWEVGVGFSPTRHYYQIEYLKPWEGVSFVYITFGNKNISSKLVENFLRQEIKNAIKYTSLRNDVMAIPLFHNKNEGPRLLDGSKFMIYKHKTKQTLTAKEYLNNKKRNRND